MNGLFSITALLVVLITGFTKADQQNSVRPTMPVIKPDTEIAFKILIVKPDSTTHFPILIQEPDR